MKNLIFIILALFVSTSIIAQDTVATKKENKNKSLLGYFILNDSRPQTTYEGGMIIENQTSYMPSAKTLELMIQHRFGSMENGISDIFGIYGTANTRLALNYSITNWLQVGFGTTKNYKLQDFSLKANLLRQTKDGKSPVDVTYYGNFSIDARANLTSAKITSSTTVQLFSMNCWCPGSSAIGLPCHSVVVSPTSTRWILCMNMIKSPCISSEGSNSARNRL